MIMIAGFPLSGVVPRDLAMIIGANVPLLAFGGGKKLTLLIV
jgi:hypothetical protein